MARRTGGQNPRLRDDTLMSTQLEDMIDNATLGGGATNHTQNLQEICRELNKRIDTLKKDLETEKKFRLGLEKRHERLQETVGTLISWLTDLGEAGQKQLLDMLNPPPPEPPQPHPAP